MKVYWHTIKGTGKGANEDRVLIGQSVKKDGSGQAELTRGFVAVADGVGGNQGGAEASDFVCQVLAQEKNPDREFFQHVNHLLIEKGAVNPVYRSMATTFSGIFLLPEKEDTILFHVGNTRVYAIQAGKYLRQITEDDTVVQRLVKTGKLTEEEVENYAARNEITACLGGGKESLLSLDEVHFRQNGPAQFLLTSDGVHEYLSTDEMEDILAQAKGDWQKAVLSLTEYALANGSNDDCTVILADKTI